jgi:hypothetical protein
MDVDHSQYWVIATGESGDDDSVSGDGDSTAEIARGLADWQPGGVMITSAVGYGRVPIDLEFLDGPPVEDVADWQDIVEFSLVTDQGELRLTPLGEEARGPNLARHGPGAYRLRLSATDRDGDGTEPTTERQRLQVWAASQAPPRLLALTSTFATTWGDRPKAREIDWPDLAKTPGVRLLVGWKQLIPPSGSHDTTSVTVTGVLPGSPQRTFGHYEYGNPGGLCEGGGGATAPDRYESHVSESGAALERASKNQPLSEPETWIGDLWLIVDQLDRQRFRYLRYTWGFLERGYEQIRHSGDRCTDAVLAGAAHPIPAGSTTVEMTFTKHPDGRLVTVHHHGVPDWLADDVQALWRISFEHNQTDTWQPLPWSLTE